VRGTAGKLFVAFLLTLCVGVYAVEMSGRWDRSIQDANDEAGFVGIVLCIGVVLSAAGSLVQRMCASRTRVPFVFAAFRASDYRDAIRVTLSISTSSPPLSLRI
jgi:hypothetical protein